MVVSERQQVCEPRRSSDGSYAQVQVATPIRGGAMILVGYGRQSRPDPEPLDN